MGSVMKKGMRADDGDEGDDEDDDGDGYGEIFLLISILKKGVRQVCLISRKMKMAILRGISRKVKI